MHKYKIILTDGTSFNIKTSSSASTVSRDYYTGEAFYEFSEGQRVKAAHVVAIVKLSTDN